MQGRLKVETEAKRVWLYKATKGSRWYRSLASPVERY